MFNEKQFKQMRLSLRYSQNKLAVELGVTQKTISRWESDGTKPNKEQLQRINDFVTAHLNEQWALSITGSSENRRHLETSITASIVLITYESGLKQWRPFNLNTLETIAHQIGWIEDVQIIEQGA